MNNINRLKNIISKKSHPSDNLVMRGQIVGSSVIVNGRAFPLNSIVDINFKNGDLVYCQFTNSGDVVIVGG